MKKFLLPLLLCAALPSHADDNIFPPSDAAKSFVNFDGKGFVINNQRTFLVSGSLHYPRVPRALWRDRLLRMKRGGFNCVQTYVFWNYHEPKEGEFDFSGEKDLDAFLKLVHEMGMYAVVRPGPYVCAEWDSGGYPVWLKFKPNVKVRQDNAEFEKYVDRYLDKVLPIIAANQINKGGAVIMVQLENEHPQGWGTALPNDYFKHLREKAIAGGIEVPYFFSGLHHGSDPAGKEPWDSKNRTSPWYTTEFWPGWYNLYGPLDAKNLRRFDRGTWKILAYGGNGYNYYMLHGGTNFDSWNNQEDASSYDYGAAIGQAGDLRPIYYRFKRAAWFARSFQEILENSENATEDYKNAATNPKIRVTARKSPAGTLIFLDNNTDEAQETKIKIDGVEHLVPPLAAGEIAPIVKDFQITPDVKIELCTLRTFGFAKQGDTTTLVLYGPDGSSGELQTVGGKQPLGGFDLGISGLPAEPGHLRLQLDMAEQNGISIRGGGLYSAKTGEDALTFLWMPLEIVDRTWFVEDDSKNYLVTGPRFLGDFTETKRIIERSPEPDPFLIATGFGGGGGINETHSFFDPISKKNKVVGNNLKMDLPEGLPNADKSIPLTAPTLSNWQMRPSPEIAANYDDANWLQSEMPLPMGADGDYGAEAWYRTNLKAGAAGEYNLRFSGARDWLGAWINGRRVEVTGKTARTAKVTLKAGDNALAVLTSHSGRDKLFGYLGSLEKIDSKGLTGAVTLTQGDEPQAKGAPLEWRWKATGFDDAALSVPVMDFSTWPVAEAGQDIFKNKAGTAWYRANLPDIAGPRFLHFESVDDKATIYLNGKKLMQHEGWDEAFDVPLDPAWHEGGPNAVAVFVENKDGVGGIGATSLYSGVADKNAILGWKMRGGAGDFTGNNWQNIAETNAPAFFKATFDAKAPGESGPHPIWRVTTTNLSRGFVWLNGHNLGRYPEKVPVNGIYLPECWINDGANEIIIFDEEGQMPTNVKIIVETSASRVTVPLMAVK